MLIEQQSQEMKICLLIPDTADFSCIAGWCMLIPLKQLYCEQQCLCWPPRKVFVASHFSSPSVMGLGAVVGV